MKNKSIVVGIVLCLSLQLKVAAYDRQDFASTTEREQREILGTKNEARLTQAKEYRENMGRADEAYWTTRAAQKEIMGRVNEAAATEAAERAARN